MEQTKPTTRAEEIAAEGPYRADWENGFSVVRDLNAPEGNKIMMMMPDNMEWFADRMNEARANGYKQGQQDRWISAKDRLPKEGERVLATDGDTVVEVLYVHYGADTRTALAFRRTTTGPVLDDVTHWQLLPTPPNPEQR